MKLSTLFNGLTGRWPLLSTFFDVLLKVYLVAKDSRGFCTFRPDVCFESSALRSHSAGKSYSSISWLKRAENALLSAFG